MPYKEQTVNLLSANAIIMNALYIPFVFLVNNLGDLIVVLILLMLVDFITGFMKSRKIKVPISRYKFEIGIYSKFFTLLFIFSFSFVAHATNYRNIEVLISWLLTIFIIIEFYSILGNGYTLRTGRILKDKDFFSFALFAIRNKVEDELSKKIKDNNEQGKS